MGEEKEDSSTERVVGCCGDVDISDDSWEKLQTPLQEVELGPGVRLNRAELQECFPSPSSSPLGLL